MPYNAFLLGHITHRIESGSPKLPVYSPMVLKLRELAAEVLRAAASPFYCGCFERMVASLNS